MHPISCLHGLALGISYLYIRGKLFWSITYCDSSNPGCHIFICQPAVMAVVLASPSIYVKLPISGCLSQADIFLPMLCWMVCESLTGVDVAMATFVAEQCWWLEFGIGRKKGLWSQTIRWFVLLVTHLRLKQIITLQIVTLRTFCYKVKKCIGISLKIPSALITSLTTFDKTWFD